MHPRKYFSIWMIVFLAFLPQFAFAYVGPGTGLSAIGAFFAFIFAMFVGILGFFWYPVKRLLRRRSGEPKQVEDSKK